MTAYYLLAGAKVASIIVDENLHQGYRGENGDKMSTSVSDEDDLCTSFVLTWTYADAELRSSYGINRPPFVFQNSFDLL
jgi:hypothetical protein